MFSQQIKNSIHGDEYYSPSNVVNMILPYILSSKYKHVWCPFDTEESNYVKIFQENELKVTYGHIETGQDFFEYDKPQGDIVISNPPFSKRDAIFAKLYDWDIPFALVMNFNGLFDSKLRSDLFRKHRIEMLIPYGRMKFITPDGNRRNKPNFQSIYVCNKLLTEQIVFDETRF